LKRRSLGAYRVEHLFALEQALALYGAYNEKVSACDMRIEAALKELSVGRGHKANSLPTSRRRTDQVNPLAFDVRSALLAPLAKDITRIDGFGPYLSLQQDLGRQVAALTNATQRRPCRSGPSVCCRHGWTEQACDRR
jgi:hypothetical protein